MKFPHMLLIAKRAVFHQLTFTIQYSAKLTVRQKQLSPTPAQSFTHHLIFKLQLNIQKCALFLVKLQDL